MKNKAIFYIIVVIITLFGSFNILNAQTSPTLRQEQIVNFVSNVRVNLDNSVDVLETITYNTGPQDRHGIYRDIYPYSSTGRKMAIDNVSVVDENNLPYIFVFSTSGSNFRIKIGDPNKTFTSQKIYVVRYHATNAVAQFKDFDEIYWNATGNEWTMPINQASASVTLPIGITMTQSSCYFGPKGSKQACALSDKTKNGEYNFSAPLALNSGEGLTVAVGFPKGSVAPYSASDSIASFWADNWHWSFTVILPILTLLMSLWYWYKKGRDPKGTGMIVPQYDVLDDLTPLEIAGIVKQRVNAKDISSEIIYLATKGYLKITQIEQGHILGLFKTADYELTKLKDFSDLPNDFDRRLLVGLFPSSQVVKLSALKNKFYKNVKPITTSVMNGLLTKGYYQNLGLMHKISFSPILTLRLILPISAMIGIVFFADDFPPVFVGILLSIFVFATVAYFFPAKTAKGVAAKEYILGLKDYLQIAEKDRLIFHNAPAKKPEIFEKLLPYAMTLGVAGIWAKEFEGIYTMPPSWYLAPTGSHFSATSFNHSVSNFGSFASTSMSSSPSGSGSGGGGFSGGGGGGGGGGGW